MNQRGVVSSEFKLFNRCRMMQTVDRPQRNNEIWYTTNDNTKIPDINTYYNDTAYVPNNTILLNVYSKDRGRIIYNNPVTAINSNAFRANTVITSISFPASVTTLPNGNMGIGCNSLVEYKVDSGNPNYCSVDGVLFSKDMTTLIAYPKGKTNTNYIIPNGVTTIGANAFYGNTYLTNVTIPDSITNIEGSAFNGCNQITSIDLPNTLISIGSSTFRSCSSLTTITIPDSVTSLGSSAFYSCTNLRTVVIGSGVTTINGETFRGCTRLNSVILPNTLKRIGGNVFNGDNNLHSLNIPEGFTTFDDAVFNGAGLYSIHIPSTVTKIGNYFFINNGYLSTITVAVGNTKFISEDNTLWEVNEQGIKIRFIKWPPTKSGNLVIPDTVTTIDGYGCCYSTNLKNVMLSYRITLVPGYCFDRGRTNTVLTIRRTINRANNSGSNDFKQVNVPKHLLNSYKTAQNWKNIASKIIEYCPFSDSCYEILTDATTGYATNSTQFQKIWVCGLDNPITSQYPNGALAAIEACTSASDMYDIAINCGY